MPNHAVIVYSPSWLIEYRFEQMILYWLDGEGAQRQKFCYTEETTAENIAELLTHLQVPQPLHPALVELQQALVTDTANIKRGPGAHPLLFHLAIEGEHCHVTAAPFMGFLTLPPPNSEN